MAMTDYTPILINHGVFTSSSNGKKYDVDLYAAYKYYQDTNLNVSYLYLGMYLYIPQYLTLGTWTDYDNSYFNVASSTENCSVSPNSYSYNIPLNQTTGPTNKWLVEDKLFTIYHNSQGYASVNISWFWGVRAFNPPTTNYWNPSGSFQIGLNHIETRPTAPTSVTVSNPLLDNKKFVVSWLGATGNITSYNIQRSIKLANSNIWQNWVNVTTTTNTTQYTDSSITYDYPTGTQIKYHVCAINSNNNYSDYLESNIFSLRGSNIFIKKNNVWINGTLWIKSDNWKRGVKSYTKQNSIWEESTLDI